MAVYEIIVVDDGSKFECPDKSIKKNPQVRIIRNDENKGRGYSRALGTSSANGDFILFVDATNQIEESFIERASPHFNDKKVAAVSGTLISKNQSDVIDRWRSRHLFRENKIPKIAESCAMLITYGTLMRRSAVIQVGNFNKKLRFKEDQDMGHRLAEYGYLIIGDPKIKIFSSQSNSLLEVLERYSRWNMDPNEKPSASNYWHNIKASIKPMMQADVQEKDWNATFISLLVPHFQLYHEIKAQLKNNKHEQK